MSNVYRVGLLLGAIGALAIFALGRMAALTAAVGVVAVGLLAGLAMAKWLEWDWFGRQIEAGLRAGLIACSLGAVAGLVTLIAQGPRDISTLAAQSHLGGLNLAPLARTLGGLGWLGVDIVVLFLACLVGIALAVGTTEVFAIGKNRAAVDAVSQARQAAEALRAGRPWSATVSRPITQAPSALSAGAQWMTSPQSAPLTTNGSRMTNAPRRTERSSATGVCADLRWGLRGAGRLLYSAGSTRRSEQAPPDRRARAGGCAAHGRRGDELPQRRDTYARGDA